MSVRAALRAGTADEHERVDALFSRFDLGTRDGYGNFLLAQAGAFLAAEAALDAAGAGEILPDWPERRRGQALRDDLTALGLAPPEAQALAVAPEPAAILGSIYVLEGSRLGGALLRRSIPADAPSRFLAAPQPAGSWRKLLETLDERLSAPDQTLAAIGAARALFARFESEGARRLRLETP